MCPGTNALFCHRESLKVIASEKQVILPVPTPLFLSDWSFVLDKQILFILSLGHLQSCNLANFISCCFYSEF